MNVMSDVERALEALRAASIAAEQTRPEVTAAYLALIREVEELPQNAPGADKSGQMGRMFAVWTHNVIGPLPRRR